MSLTNLSRDKNKSGKSPRPTEALNSEDPGVQIQSFNTITDKFGEGGRNGRFEVIGLYEALTAGPLAKWNYTVKAVKGKDGRPLKWWKIKRSDFRKIIMEPLYHDIFKFLVECGAIRWQERIAKAKTMFDEGGVFETVHGIADDYYTSDLGSGPDANGPAEGLVFREGEDNMSELPVATT